MALAPTAASATVFRVLLDTNPDPSSGCSYTVDSIPYSGIEHEWQVTVDTNSPIPAGSPVVTMTRDVCGTPGTGPQSVALGLATSLPSGLDVIEIGAPLGAGDVQARFFASDDTATDSVGPVTFRIVGGGGPSVVEIPTLGEWGLILLAL